MGQKRNVTPHQMPKKKKSPVPSRKVGAKCGPDLPNILAILKGGGVGAKGCSWVHPVAPCRHLQERWGIHQACWSGPWEHNVLFGCNSRSFSRNFSEDGSITDDYSAVISLTYT